jgi:3-dehydroquinate synthase
MPEIKINTASGNSRIILGEHLPDLLEYIPCENVVIVTDENIYKHYSSQFPPFPVIRIGTGEKIKNLDTVRDVYNQLITENADRSTFILGIGGGVVCDIAGFVASTFLRGLSFGYVATSLLSQVDASLGGKNGVNFNGFKNLIGIIRQPAFVLCDPNMLDTLSYREYLSGFAEIVKYAVIRDKEMFQQIEDNIDKIKKRDKDLILSLITDSINIKASIVEKDEGEQGLRRILNYGHTFGHAIEKVHDLKHGEAISIGMVMANRFCVGRGIVDQAEEHRVTNLLEKLDLYEGVVLDRNGIWEAMLLDKKKYRDKLLFVAIDQIGNGYVDEVSLEELHLFLRGVDKD